MRIWQSSVYAYSAVLARYVILGGVALPGYKKRVLPNLQRWQIEMYI